MSTWQEEVAILRVARGALYRRRRDAFLAAPPPQARDALDQASTSADADQATTTSILLGWMDHRALYEAVTAELDAVDGAKLSSSQMGFDSLWQGFAERARETWKQSILPLCWEEITRFADASPDFRTITFLRMIRAVPDARSIEPVIAALEGARSYGLADACANTLRALPSETVRGRAAEMFDRHDRWGALYQRIVREDRS